MIDDALQAVNNDLSHLALAKRMLDEVRVLLAETSKVVRRTSSRPLIVDLEDMYEGLESVELATLLSSRRWNDHESVVEEMKCELEQLRTMAEGYAEEEAWQEEGGRGEPRRDRMDEATACKILGVPATATNEEIRRMYRYLARLWHPDAGKAPEDHQMRRINQAYEYLREKRSI